MALPKLDVPIFETKLISTGETVKFRPFLVKEQKLFLMAAQSNDIKDITSAIKQVINNCVVSDVDIETLPTFDLEKLFMKIRAHSVGEIANLRYTCNNKVTNAEGQEKTCGGVVEIDVNILDMEPKFGEGHNKKIELTENLGIVMKYPNFKLLEKLNSKEDVDLLNLFVACIDYIYDSDQVYYAKDTPESELVEFIESMQPGDLEKIQKFFTTMPKFSEKFDFKCPRCGYNETITIEGIENFFG